MNIKQKGIFFGPFPWFLIAALLYASIWGIRIYLSSQNDPGQITEKFQNENETLEKEIISRVNRLTDFFTAIPKKDSLPGFDPVENENGGDEVLLFVFQNDSLVYWNNNEVILPSGFINTSNKNIFACQLKNGWHVFHWKNKGAFHFLGGYLVKNEFPFQNDFINDHFASGFSVSASVGITKEKGLFPVFSIDHTYLFSLNFDNFTSGSSHFNLIIFLLFVAFFLCVYYSLFLFLSGINWFRTRDSMLVLIYSVAIILLRILQNYSGFPKEIYQSDLFTPALYSSSSFLPSLGDFTLNALLVFVISFIVYKKVVILPEKPDARRNYSLARSSIALCIILLLFQVVGYFITDLVINSSVPLNLQNVSGLTYESGFGLFIISVLLFSLWLVSVRLFDVVFVVRENHKGLIYSFILVAGIYFAISRMAARSFDWIVPLFFAVYFVLFWYLKLKNKPLFSVQQLFIFLVFYAVFGTFLLNRSNQTKEDEKIKLLAGKLITQRNPVTEILFEQIEHRLKADSVISKWLTADPKGNKVNEDSLANYLLSQYFNDYWKKYQVQITLCGPAKELRVQPQGYLVNCNAYFQEIIRNYGKATVLPDLFFLDYGYGKEYYLFIISENAFITDSAKSGIFIELNLKNAYPGQGYPGLLMDKTRLDLSAVSDYSYGLYQNGLLIRSVGPAGYKTELKKYPDFPVTKPFFTDEEWVHYFYRINDNDSLLISKKKESFLTVSTPFSYLFIIFSCLVVLVSMVVSFPKNRLAAPASLRNRLHFSLLGILVVTLLAIGIVQVANIVQINLKKNVDNLRERAYSVVVEVQHKYGSLPEMKSVARGEQEDFLTKLSNVFFTDINIYSENGILLSSSRPQIFEEGLQSERMNAAAYQKLIAEKNSLLIHYESIGKMQFNSAYLPFYNDRDKLLGFVNLPYFARQDESKKEISTFLVTFLNVYILLILFGVFVTVLITNYITAPLAMLAGKMSQLRLGMVNEKIAWKQKDEIGQLVSEYNKMIDKLGNSAEILARSERESAWRQMARQVAHEIKNPLTPMKLSAQYLEKAWNDKAPDWDQRLARFTVTLVEQIDALSVIASDFSNFAQMPTVAFSPIDLNEVLQFVRTLYQDTPAVRYEYHSDIPVPVIYGDRSQLIRLFTNLLNNAIQAIGERGEGVIRIDITKEHEHIIVKVSDNGCGISPHRFDRIFQPDFTTKTSGMGLGLAIVKGIVEGMGGEISFISEEHKGTTFIIKFPLYGEDSK